MVTTAFILAEGLGGLGDVLFIVVVVVLVLIGKLFQKNAEQRQEQEGEPHADEDRETIARRRPDADAEHPATPAPAARETTQGPLDSRHLREMERAEVGQALASQRTKGARVSSRRKPGSLGEIAGQTEQPAVRTLLEVDLSRRSQARQAMIYHEIFSSPKALRSGKEMWDR